MSDGYKEQCIDDADPMQPLVPPEKEKTAMSKPYDIKTSCWGTDEKGFFLAVEIQSEKDDKVTGKMVTSQLSNMLLVQQESSSLLPPEVQPLLSLDLFCSVGQWMCGTPLLRPPARAARRPEVAACLRECLPVCSPRWMFLKEASVLDNLCQLYTHMRIYELKGQRGSNVGLEDQTIQVNPVLETLENAKTTRKKNSSHFGSISPSLPSHWANLSDFTLAAQGSRLGLALRALSLEKSRAISWGAAKRYHHIFHQIPSKKKLDLTVIQSRCAQELKLRRTLSLQPKKLMSYLDCTDGNWCDPLLACLLLQKLLLVPNPSHYYGVHQGVITADNTDDGEETLLTNVAFDVLGSSPEEKICVPHITGWLQKSEDLNEAIVGLLQKSSMPLALASVLENGASPAPRETDACSLGSVKAPAALLQKHARTDGSEQLNLMTALHSTSPHFIHSIVPNESKQADHYTCLPSVIPPGFVNNKKASELLPGSTDLGEKEYRTRIFFSAGILATLEDMRDEPLAKILTMLCCAHGFLMRREYKNMLQRKFSLMAIQRNVEKFLLLFFWGGWKLYSREYAASMKGQFLLRLPSRSPRMANSVGFLCLQALDHRVRTLTSDLSAQNGSVTEFLKEKRALEEVHQAEITALFYFIPILILLVWGKEKTHHYLAYANSLLQTAHAAPFIETSEEGRWRNKEDCLEEADVATAAQLRLKTDRQMDNLSASMESLQKSKLNSDAHVHKPEDHLSEANAQQAEVEKSQAEINAIRLQAQNSWLSREHKEAQQLNQIVCIKTSLTSQADDFKRLDEESKYLEEEEESKAELQCLVSTLNTEVMVLEEKVGCDSPRRRQLTQSKPGFPTERKLSRNFRKKQRTSLLTSRQQEIHPVKTASRTSLTSKVLATAACAAMEKKQRAFDEILTEWQQKTQELQVEADSSQEECAQLKILSLRLLKIFESSEQLESLKKENKEIKDLINQLGEGGKSIHRWKRQRQEIEDELQVALEEAVFPGGWIRLNITECCTICFTGLCRNNHQHAIESLQASLETKGNAEAHRLKKMDSELTRMEMQLDHTNRNSELARTPNKLQQHVKIHISLLTIKLKVEPDLQHTTNEHEEIITGNLKAFCMAKDPCQEQDHYVYLEKIKNDNAIKDLQVKMEAKQLVLKGGKKINPSL
ncbi:LOW QUALITY PROTEIN: uncharacterized protein MYH16 [Porphyrio hochstetteri]